MAENGFAVSFYDGFLLKIVFRGGFEVSRQMSEGNFMPKYFTFHVYLLLELLC